MKVKEFMSKNVISVDIEMTVKEFINLAIEKKFTGAPVMERDKLVGIISVTDVIKRSDYIHQELAHCEDCYELDTTTGLVEVHRYYTDELFEKEIGCLMTPAEKLISISPEADVEDAVKLFLETPVHRLLVMDKKEIVGIISTKDTMKAMAKKFKK